MERVVCAWWLALLVAGASLAGEQAHPGMTAAPAPPRVPVVLELFTSEGCSSCPPADRLLAELLEEQPVPGALVIGISEHVDYWDHQGWRDPFSSALFTRRQQVFAARFGTDRIYTPQIVVDGRAEFVGGDRAEALAGIRRAAASPKTPIGLAWATSERRAIHVQVAPGAAPNADVWLVMVEDGLSSVVTRGENDGHTLHHAAVARRLTKLGETSKDGSFEAEPAAAPDPEWHAQALTAVVVLQDRRSGAIIGAGALHR